MFQNIGTTEWIIIAVVIVLLFGGKKIPELLRGVGKGVGELQKGLEEGKRQITASVHEDETEKRVHKTADVADDHVVTK